MSYASPITLRSIRIDFAGAWRRLTGTARKVPADLTAEECEAADILVEKLGIPRTAAESRARQYCGSSNK